MSDGSYSGGSSAGISGPIPAGWYPDPAGGNGKRWWDGTQWTQNVREPEPEPALPSFGNYIPADQRAVHAVPTADAGIAYTRASWWIAFSPIWIVVTQAIVVESISSLTPGPESLASLTPLIPGLALLNLVLWVLLVLLAFGDRARLLAHGNDTAASPWWILLTPLAYLIVRAQHVRLYALGGWASVVWWCIAVVVTPGLAVAGIFAAYGIFGN